MLRSQPSQGRKMEESEHNRRNICGRNIDGRNIVGRKMIGRKMGGRKVCGKKWGWGGFLGLGQPAHFVP